MPHPLEFRRGLAAATLVCLGSFAPGCSPPTVEADDPIAFREVVSDEARLDRLATGLGFTEGPVWSDAAGGFLVFSDLWGDRLLRWSPADGVTTWRTPCPEPNGNARDGAGRLHTCEHGSRRISRTEPDGTIVTVVDRFLGRRLNSPNDLVFAADGTLWFTDPTYGLRDEVSEVGGEHVYRLAPDGTLTAPIQDVQRPNGICLSPDGRRLFVSDSGDPRHVRVFEVGDDGAVTGGAVHYDVEPGLPDGLTCDEAGRLYVTAGDGVHVLAPDGRRIGRILVPEPCTNVTFGGSDRRTLFVTAGASLYAIELSARGPAPREG